MAMLQDELTVKDPQISDPTVRDKFDVKIEPVEPKASAEQVGEARLSRDGYGERRLPVGRFHSWLTLHTNLPDAEKLDIPIVGQVVGDISVSGVTGWNEEAGRAHDRQREEQRRRAWESESDRARRRRGGCQVSM